MIAKAYAKINWYLKVLGKLPSGYHDLESVMQHIDLHDDLHFEPLPDSRLELSVEGADALSASDDNLVLKAARVLQRTGNPAQGASIRLIKRIPMGAGLGGGSADAAATLLALNRMWGLGFPLGDLQRMGASVGADIPYCLESRPALVRGIGEKVTPLHIDGECPLLLLKPDASLSTREVFSRFSQSDIIPGANARMTVKCLQSAQYSSLREVCINSLQAPAAELLPEISRLIASLYQSGAEFAQMSGSGSAVFGVFSSLNAARAAMQSIAHTGVSILTKTLRLAEAL